MVNQDLPLDEIANVESTTGPQQDFEAGGGGGGGAVGVIPAGRRDMSYYEGKCTLVALSSKATISRPEPRKS